MKELGRFYSKIFDKRQTSDYDDFINYEKEDIIALIKPATDFIDTINKLIEVNT